MDNHSTFIDQLIVEKGFDEKDPEIVAQIKADLEDRLEDKINALILRELPEDSLDEFNTLLDRDDEKELTSFIQKNIPDIDTKIATELLIFRQTYLG